MSIEELIAALEAAKRPSRELDRCIARTIGWHRVEPRFHKGGAWIAPQDFKGITSSGSPILDSWHGTDMHKDVPPFTASLDAALTILPTDVCWLLGAGRTRPDEPLYGAQVFRPGQEHPIGEGESNATAAIALCIAALKARVAMGTLQC